MEPIPNRKRPPASCRFLYKDRNLVGRFFDRINPFRAVATRYDKLAENYLAGVQLASARLRMRAHEPMT